MTRSSITWLLGLLAAISVAATAHAQDNVRLVNGWVFSATPYLWFPSVSGQETIKGLTANVSAGFSDIFDHTDKHLGALGDFEAWKDDFGGFINFNYLNLGQNNIPTGPTLTNVNFKLTLVDFGLMYRIHEWRFWSGDPEEEKPRRVRLDAYLGGRFTDLYGKLEVQNVALVDSTKLWTDPLLGGRVTADITDRFNFLLQADVGGTSASNDFTWSAAALFGYGFTMWGLDSRVLAGYRALSQNWASGSGNQRFRWNTTMYGPVLGLTIKF
jgi:hypothetical protein